MSTNEKVIRLRTENVTAEFGLTVQCPKSGAYIKAYFSYQTDMQLGERPQDAMQRAYEICAGQVYEKIDTALSGNKDDDVPF